MENVDLLRAMQEMVERQIGSLASKNDTNLTKAEAKAEANLAETKANMQ
jgi:hypothetical protein